MTNNRHCRRPPLAGFDPSVLTIDPNSTFFGLEAGTGVTGGGFVSVSYHDLTSEFMVKDTGIQSVKIFFIVFDGQVSLAVARVHESINSPRLKPPCRKGTPLFHSSKSGCQ